MNYDWALEAPNQNHYTDKPSVDYAYYIIMTCLTKVNTRSNQGQLEGGC